MSTGLYIWKTTWLGTKMVQSHFLLSVLRDVFQCLLALHIAIVKSEARLNSFSMLNVTFFLCLDANMIFFLLDSVALLRYVLVLFCINFPETLCVPFLFLNSIFWRKVSSAGRIKLYAIDIIVLCVHIICESFSICFLLLEHNICMYRLVFGNLP